MLCVCRALQDIIELAMAGEAAPAAKRGAKAAARTISSKGPAAAATAAANSSSPAGWQGWIEESFDSSALLLAGGVLAVFAGSLLVLGGAAYARSRSS
jgi:hypothetical protein